MRVNAGSALCGSSQNVDALDLAGGHRVGAGHVEQRTAVGSKRRGACPASDAAARAAGQPEQHGLGLVVEGVPEQHQRGAEVVGHLVEHGVPRLAGGRLDAPAAGLDP